uniref:AI-2E family transporter n=2 Tax=Cohnella candidum TaxID=2674991 RepID=A0A3G3K4S5_9BACL|nr:AI-2E family transporter [Cohnella candidum]
MIYLATKISFLLNPLLKMVHILLIPMIFSGFFYYSLRPLVNYFAHRKVNRSLAILFVYFVLTALIALLGMVIWPILLDQVQTLTDNLPSLIEGFRSQVEQLQHNRFLSMFASGRSDWSTRLSGYLDNSVQAITDYVSQSLVMLSNFFLVAATVPIIVYYLLKEGERLPGILLHFVPRAYRKEGRNMLSDMDAALSGYIVGRIIVTSILSVMLYVGFLLVHLPYALLLAVISFLFNLIPYIGQFIGAVPVLIVAFIDSPAKALWILVIMTAIQIIEGNVISPHVYGMKLDIHPLTTILVLLIGGDLLGLVGILAAIPIYMLLKILILYVYRLFFEEKVEELVD